MTAKDLKELLKDIPDETPIALYKSNMEGSGYTDKYINVHLKQMVRVEETRIDAFDHIAYTAEVLKNAAQYDLPAINVLVIE